MLTEENGNCMTKVNMLCKNCEKNWRSTVHHEIFLELQFFNKIYRQRRFNGIEQIASIAV